MAGYMPDAKTVEWGTPRYLFDELDREFSFTLDAAAQPYNAKCAQFFTPKEDGLKQPWTGRVFVNPPYGRVINKWVNKALAERANTEVIVMLLPARTGSPWFHKLFDAGAKIRFLKGRLHFETPEGIAGEPATFPSLIVTLRGCQ